MNIRLTQKAFVTTKWQQKELHQQLCPCLPPPYCLKSFFVCLLLVLFFLCSVLSHRSGFKQSMSAGSQRVYRGLSDCFGHTQHFHHGFQGIRNDTHCCHERHLLKPFYIYPWVSFFSDPAEFRSRSQPLDEEGIPGPSVLSADPSV